MLTSSKWLSEVRPHPIYKFLLSKGVNIRPVILLPSTLPTILCFPSFAQAYVIPRNSVFQFIYTILTLFPAWIAYRYYWANAAYLCIVFVVACWYGASFYFDIFSENYSKRLQRSIREESEKGDDSRPKIDNKYHPTSWMSVLSFIAFFVLFLCFFLMLMSYFC